MLRKYHKWFSTTLGRDMELLTFGNHGTPVLVFPTRQGRFYDYEDWGLVQCLHRSIDEGYIRLCCVDALDSESLYCATSEPRERIRRHSQYERYILDEVMPFMAAAKDTQFIAHGCSIGAYHAMNLALRHPWLFCKTVALSGRFDLTRAVGPFRDLFEGHYDQDIYFHTPNHFLPGLSDSNYLRPLRRMEIIMAVGETDPFRASNEQLSHAFLSKGVPHTFALWEGDAHRAAAWRQMAPTYL